MFQVDTDRATPQPLARGGALDALRFLAAFCMVVYHYAVEAPVPLERIHPVFQRGYLATDFFIIVSGYVMGRIYGDRVLDGRVGVGDFFLRRAGRLVPAHLLMVAAFVVLVLASSAAGIHPAHPEWLQWDQLPGQIFLVTALGIGGQGWNSPTWSLSALLVCYLAFPMLWRGLRRLGRTSLILAVPVLAMTAGDLLSRRFLGLPLYELQEHTGVIRAVPLFIFGAALAAVGPRLTLNPLAAKLATGAALIALIAVQVAGRYDFVSIMLIGTMVVAAGAIPVAKPSKVLEKAALVSFALFITSELVRNLYFGVAHAVAAKLHFDAQLMWAAWFASLGVAVACAVAFHYLVDWPSQGWLRKRSAEAAAWFKAGGARAVGVAG